MADSTLAQMSPEGIKKVGESLVQMKKAIDNQKSLLDMGILTIPQLEELKVVYESTKKMYDLYAPKQIV